MRHYHDDKPYAEWFNSLMQPGSGVSCCHTADCKTRPFRLAGDHWEVFIDDTQTWLAVPPEKILVRENPTGEAVACWRASLGLMCFVPPSET